MRSWCVLNVVGYLFLGMFLLSETGYSAKLIRKVDLGTMMGCALFDEVSVDEEQSDQTRIRCWDVNHWFREPEPSGINFISPYSTISTDTSAKKVYPLPWFGDNAVDFAISGNALCAILKNASVACVGEGYTSKYNGSGIPDWERTRSSPVEVPLGEDVPEQIASGVNSFCVSTNTNRIHCWSYFHLVLERDDHYWLIHPFKDAKEWRPLTNSFDVGAPIQKIAVGQGQFCALLKNGEVKCFSSRNQKGVLGSKDKKFAESMSESFIKKLTPARDKNGLLSGRIDLTDPMFSIPTGKKRAVDIYVNGAQNCVVLEDGSAQCWGSSEVSENNKNYVFPELVPWERWYGFTLRDPLYPGYREPDLRFYRAVSQNQKVVRVMGADSLGTYYQAESFSRFCFLVTPGDSASSSNLKCTKKIQDAQKLNSPFWLDSLDWVSVSLPVKEVIAGKADYPGQAGVCVILLNGGMKCGKSLETIASDRDFPFMVLE